MPTLTSRRAAQIARWPFLAVFLAAAPARPAELPPLIPREVIFGNPERISPKLSPDAKRLA